MGLSAGGVGPTLVTELGPVVGPSQGWWSSPPWPAPEGSRLGRGGPHQAQGMRPAARRSHRPLRRRRRQRRRRAEPSRLSRARSLRAQPARAPTRAWSDTMRAAAARARRCSSAQALRWPCLRGRGRLDLGPVRFTLALRACLHPLLARLSATLPRCCAYKLMIAESGSRRI